MMTMSVCLCAIISQEIHVRSSPNFLRMLAMAMARSSSGDVAIRYVLPVLWMTSYLHTNQGSLFVVVITMLVCVYLLF